MLPFVFFSSLLFFGGAYFAHRIAFPVDVAVLRELRGRAASSFFPTIDKTFAFYVKVVARPRPDLPDADARVLPRALRRGHGRLPAAEDQVRRADHRGARGGDHAERRSVTLAIFAAPMLVLYLVSIGVAWLFEKKRSDDD